MRVTDAEMAQRIKAYKPLFLALDGGSLRGVIGNVLQAACASDDDTSRALLYEIRAHYQCQQEEQAREAVPL